MPMTHPLRAISPESLESRLSVRLHKPDVDALVSAASDDSFGAPVLDGLLRAAISSPDAHVASNAAWALTHLPRRLRPWISAHRARLADRLLASRDVTLRRLLVTLLAGLDWAEADLRTDLFDFALASVTDCAAPLGIRAQSVYLAHKMCATVPDLAREFSLVKEVLSGEDLAPGLRAALRRTM